MANDALPARDSAPDRAPTPAEQAALEWVVRHDRGLTAADERAFAAWLEADASHRGLFQEFGGTWTLMRQAPPLSATGTSQMPRAAELTSSVRRSRTSFWVPLAAAAALTLAYFQWQRHAPIAEPMATEIGTSRQWELADGSRVRLNTDSVLVTDFTTKERRVRLQRGEAFFEVAKNPARPFIVEAAGVTVRAVGTAFNVRLGPEDVDVLVTEGKVRVGTVVPPTATARPSLAEISAHQRVVVSRAVASAPAPVAPPVARVPADEVARRLAWQDGRLDFFDTPLGEMVAEFNRYNRHQLAIVDPELAALRFGGAFRPDDRAGFVRALRQNFGVQVEERENQTLLRRAP